MTTAQVRATRIIGSRPRGSATGSERWASITDDDGMVTVTAYRGWGITDEVRLHGKTAASLDLTIAHQLIGDFS